MFYDLRSRRSIVWIICNHP